MREKRRESREGDRRNEENMREREMGEGQIHTLYKEDAEKAHSPHHGIHEAGFRGGHASWLQLIRVQSFLRALQPESQLLTLPVEVLPHWNRFLHLIGPNITQGMS